MSDELTILIADDHPMVRMALRQTVAGAVPGARLIEVATFESLVAHLGTSTPTADLILLDLNMPGMQGFVGLITLQANWPTVPVIMVSASEDATVVAQAQHCGASGFIPKSAPMETVVTAIDRVLAGGTWFDAFTGAPSGCAPLPGSDIARRLMTLTPQQMRVLHMVLEGKLNKQIAADLDLAEQTVKGHVSHILQKLDLNSRTQVVIAVGPMLAASTSAETE